MFAYICYLKCIQRDTARHSNSLGWRTREVSVLQSKPYDFLGEVLDLFLPTSELQAPGFPFEACPSTNTGASIETPSSQGCCLHGSSCCRINASRNPDELRNIYHIRYHRRTTNHQRSISVCCIQCCLFLCLAGKEKNPAWSRRALPVTPSTALSFLSTS